MSDELHRLLASLTHTQRSNYELATESLAEAKQTPCTSREVPNLIRWFRGYAEDSTVPLSLFGTTEDELKALERTLRIQHVREVSRCNPDVAERLLEKFELTPEDIDTTSDAIKAGKRAQYAEGARLLVNKAQNDVRKALASLQRADEALADAEITREAAGLPTAFLAALETAGQLLPPLTA